VKRKRGKKKEKVLLFYVREEQKGDLSAVFKERKEKREGVIAG